MQRPLRQESMPVVQLMTRRGHNVVRPHQGCRVLAIVGLVGEKSLPGHRFKRYRGLIPTRAVSEIVGCRALLAQEVMRDRAPSNQLAYEEFKPLLRTSASLSMAGTPATWCRWGCLRLEHTSTQAYAHTTTQQQSLASTHPT